VQSDNAQEFLYRKLFDRKGRVIESHTIAGNADAGATLTQAQRDLRVNWRRYRAAFRGEDHGRNDIDPVQAAQITERINQAFDFVRDVIDDPQILDTIPNGSELAFRDAVDQERSIRLTAYLPKHPGARWGARVSGVTSTATADAPPPSETQATPDYGGGWPSVAGYDTSDVALDALETELRAFAPSGWAARRAAGD
jgi:hypothetical protein